MRDTYAIVLAAGKGTRMSVPYPKVLAALKGKPLIHWVLEQVRKSGINDVVMVIGYQAEQVREALVDESKDLDFAMQDEQLGTGHAVQVGLKAVSDDAKTILVTYGDTPFISPGTFQALIAKQKQSHAAIVLTTFIVENPVQFGYGRVKRNVTGGITKIVEQKVCTPEELAIQECNAGAVVYDAVWLRHNLDKLQKSAAGEYYLTDLVALASKQGEVIESITVADTNEMHGINTVDHLKQAESMITPV